jgi:prolyl 4-hydroxylase
LAGTRGARGCADECSFEAVQVARYGPGGKYDAHYDGDDCGPGAGRPCPADQRLATLLMYLSEPESGGATRFPLLDVEVAPEKGKALFFWVADPATRELFEKTLHGGMPVGRGTKWIANQWARPRADAGE